MGLKIFGCLMLVLWSFLAGAKTQEWFHGSIRLTHNIRIEGDDLNRGQTYIDIDFPHGVKLGQILLPDGSLFPNEKPRWVEVIGPHGETKDWIDRLSFETYIWGDKNAPCPRGYHNEGDHCIGAVAAKSD